MIAFAEVIRENLTGAAQDVSQTLSGAKLSNACEKALGVEVSRAIWTSLVWSDLWQAASGEMSDEQCTMRFTVEGPETFLELRDILRNTPRGIFAEVTKATIRGRKEQPDGLYRALMARFPLFGLD